MYEVGWLELHLQTYFVRGIRVQGSYEFQIMIICSVTPYFFRVRANVLEETISSSIRRCNFENHLCIKRQDAITQTNNAEYRTVMREFALDRN